MAAWPHIRAIALTLVLLSCTWVASPHPGWRPERLNDAKALAQISPFMPVLGVLGFEEEREVAQLLIDVRNTSKELKQRYKRSYDWFSRYTQAQQGWGLFATPATYYDVLVIDIRRDKQWEIVHRTDDPEFDLDKERLRYRRVRAMIFAKTKVPSDRWHDFTQVHGRWVLDQYPDANKVRYRLHRRSIQVPGKTVEEPLDEWRFTKVVKRP